MRPDGAITAVVTLGRSSYSDAARRFAFFEAMEQRLAHIPGVVADCGCELGPAQQQHDRLDVVRRDRCARAAAVR